MQLKEFGEAVGKKVQKSVVSLWGSLIVELRRVESGCSSRCGSGFFIAQLKAFSSGNCFDQDNAWHSI